MKIIVGSKIKIENPTPPVMSYCRRLVLPNPDYYKKERMGKWTGGTPQNIVLYERVGDSLILPFGCLADLWASFRNECEWGRDICDLRPVLYQSRISLYPYQEKAVSEALAQRNGVIVMPCGAGKTQTGLELISRIGGRALWLTHTQDLLNQSFARARSVFDLDLGSYGKITNGKVNIGSGITFATVQTMAKIDLSDLRYAFDVVVVDECHKAIGSPTKVMQFYKVLSALSCRHKFGLTATPKRSDGLEASMFALLGDICAKVDKSAVADTTCPVKVIPVRTSYSPSLDVVLAGDGTLNYARLIDDLTHDDDRFSLVLQSINQIRDAQAGGALVLANRVDYLQRLFDAYGGRSLCLSGMGNSKKAKAERKEALRRLNAGDLDCVFATYQLAKEGLDVPNLRYVVFATPEKDETTVTQSVGRVGRKAEGKPCGHVIDFVDDFAMFRGWHKKRLGYYKKIDAEVDCLG